jgi:Family of unknown function (DUF5318)
MSDELSSRRDVSVRYVVDTVSQGASGCKQARRARRVAPARIAARPGEAGGRVRGPAYARRVPIRRSIVDYALQRRALLADLRSGRVGGYEVCDAHPYLQRAAKYHGDETETTCPICRREQLTEVHYVYGDELRHISGQAKSARELDLLAEAHTGFSVYVVEVCRSCGWNPLTLSFVVADDEDRTAVSAGRRRRSAR